MFEQSTWEESSGMKRLWGWILPVELQSRGAVHFKSKLKIPSERAGGTWGMWRRGRAMAAAPARGGRRGALQAPRSPPWRPWAAGQAAGASRAGIPRQGRLGTPWAVCAQPGVTCEWTRLDNPEWELRAPRLLPALRLSPAPHPGGTAGFLFEQGLLAVQGGFAPRTCQFLNKSCRAG